VLPRFDLFAAALAILTLAACGQASRQEELKPQKAAIKPQGGETPAGFDERKERPAAAAQLPPGPLEKFQPPASGVITLGAGATIWIIPREAIDVAAMFPHQLLAGEITSDIAAKPTGIPIGAVVNLEILRVPADDASKTVFGLAAININGHLYKVPGAGSASLGVISLTGKPGPRFAAGTVLGWKLAQPIVLREVK
jgi:hypothetical protein